MRLVTVGKNGETFVGSLLDDRNTVIHLVKAGMEMEPKVRIPETMIECIGREDLLEQVNQIENWVQNQENKDPFVSSLDELTLLAPIPRPLKNIFCVGKNFAEHAIEVGSKSDIPEYPIIFSKTPTTVTGPGSIVFKHQDVTDQLDYEGELAFVIGKTGKGIPKEEAMDYVFGYTIINDITARDLQSRHKQFLLGKSLDTSCPMGPCIIHKTKIKDPNHLKIITKVNGEVRQSGSTEQFIFDIPTLISVISKGTTLEAGDIIATGTPAGVGKGFTPPKYLQAGDEVVVSIEGIGKLKNIIEER